jgi:catalase
MASKSKTRVAEPVVSKHHPDGVPETDKDKDLALNKYPPLPELTTNQGLRIDNDDNSLKAGPRGPTLLEDFHFREKITHFDHERIPERVVHARGVGAHGYFQPYKAVPELCKAGFLQDPSKQTPVFMRFSTVAGSRGSADTPRDVRGFAIKFYTDEGIWDMVGNNIPIFFIQDAIKFPDLIHAVKPEPNNEIPQAASAHDTFWDFVSLQSEATAMLMWVMSDRALPRSLSMMEGFGIHTYRMIDTEGKSRFVKFHFKPVKGVHSLVWDESQKIAGKDADFHRRDLWDSIENGDFPEWEFGVQVVEEADEFKFDFDLLDATKLIPEELVPVTPLGRLVLNRNTDNYFAETEQVAFHLGHVVPGIDFSNDPLLQGRLFSYIDTQISRIGPNFAELPINRPTCPFSNNQRDGKMRMTINPGRVAYQPASVAPGPIHTGPQAGTYTSYPAPVDGAKMRKRADSFADHFSQATLFWNSMSPWEKQHIIEAFSFELNQVDTLEIRERVVNELLAHVAPELAAGVAEKIGFKKVAKGPAAVKPAQSSPALSMDKPSTSIKGRKVGILVADGVDGKDVDAIKARLKSEGAHGHVISRLPGSVDGAHGKAVAVDKPAPNAPSVFYDAVFIPGGEASAKTLSSFGPAIHFVNEAFAHGKPVAAVGEGVTFLSATNAGGSVNSKHKDGTTPDRSSANHGVVTGSDAAAAIDQLVEAMKQHRFFNRAKDMVPA